MQDISGPPRVVTVNDREGQLAAEMFRVQYNMVGLNEECAQRLNKNYEFAAHLRTAIRRFSGSAPDYAVAQSILGIDFITPKEVNKIPHPIRFTDEQILLLENSLPSVEILEWCKENDYTVTPAPPESTSVTEILFGKHEPRLTRDVRNEDTVSPGWLLIKKIAVNKSFNKSFNNQQSWLMEFEKVPNIAEICWFLTVYFQVRNIRLFDTVYVRTSSLDIDTAHPIYVGRNNDNGAVIGQFRSGHVDDNLGLAAARSC